MNCLFVLKSALNAGNHDMNIANALTWCMNVEKKHNDRSGIYGFTQRALAYNSNKIEGSTLTEYQTAPYLKKAFFLYQKMFTGLRI